MRKDFAVVTEEGKSFLVVKAVPENTQKKTSLSCMQQAVTRHFFTRVKDGKHNSL